jgi:hypothetical protein
MSTQFDTVGMPSFTQNEPVKGGLLNTERGNPLGDKVDNTAGTIVTPAAQGLSTNMGAEIEMQSRPSTLY